MAVLTSLRPRSSALLVDEKGREMSVFPADVARALVFLDDQLGGLHLKFNIECPECSMANQRPSYALPRVQDGVFTLNCDHASRRVRLEHA